MLDASGKLFGKINVIDFSLMFFVVIVVFGILLVQSGLYKTSGQIKEGETDIEYTVYLRNVKTLDPNAILKPGKFVSISIRNRPRGKVKIIESTFKPKQAIIPKGNGTYTLVADPDDQNGYDYLVKLRDHALVTKDSFVTNGVKVKLGMTLIIEGFNFRLPGIIADVQRVYPDTLEKISD